MRSTGNIVRGGERAETAMTESIGTDTDITVEVAAGTAAESDGGRTRTMTVNHGRHESSRGIGAEAEAETEIANGVTDVLNFLVAGAGVGTSDDGIAAGTGSGHRTGTVAGLLKGGEA